MKWSSISFRKRMLIIMTLSGLIELLILVAAGFIYIKQAQEDEMGHQALGVASFLAKSPYVISAIENGVDQESQQRYRSLTNLIGAAFIVIGDKDGIRLVHPLDERIGKPMKGGDNDRALVGGEAYISVAEGSLGYSVRGKTAVFNEQGEIIGVVSVGYLIDRLQDRIEPFIIFLVLMAFIVVGANAIVSSYASRRFQKAILGFEPEEIGRLYVELDVTLETLKEGIITIDDQGKLRSINRSACQILNLNKEQSIRPLSEILPESDLHTVIQTARTDHDINLYLNKQRLIANRSPIIVDGKVVGAVSSFRRRDDLTELTEQLAKTKEYAEMLRSQTHEHRNKLNTISGMVQMGELEAVQYLIGQETAHYQALIEFLRETIKEPLIAGMLLGKTERARELGLQLVVEEGSRLEPLPQRINPEDLVTILGNLIDNAFDATRDAITRDPLFPADRRLVEVSISDYGNEVILEVVDQGCGLPDNVSVDSLVERGVSSKDSSTRGVGLFLTNQLATRYHGELEMMNNKDCGARMTVYLPKDEQI
ncbi:sensor histidine kinase [Vibrio europaeus]|uniref:ATP-binding protein n=1 Tax=Vibrio europaeus TaxID=300876 RepID=UPI0018A7131C|nr:sensor histidine kinase [Vibrio europaeus]QPG35145.1 sensor histidine kinase [Vibrio europaeus]